MNIPNIPNPNKPSSVNGCTEGIVIYNTAKKAAQIRNLLRPRNSLNEVTKAKMGPLFPRLNLNKVRIRPGCSLPANWGGAFNIPDETFAMTFGYTIYFKRHHVQATVEGLNLLMHELVHVDQIRRCNDNEEVFACWYGRGFVSGGGSYRNNPLEIEAYNFVTEHAFTDMSVPVASGQPPVEREERTRGPGDSWNTP